MTKRVYMIGGPNGAGKTTAAMTLLPYFLSVNEFVNADNIARGLSPLNQDSMAIAAGKLMINRMYSFIKEGKDFAFETTCAGKNHAKIIKRCKENGYETCVIFFWLPNVDMAIERVANRVLEGGHNIDEMVIRRRYKSGLINLHNLYIPLFDNVIIYDTASDKLLSVIASKVNGSDLTIVDKQKWQQVLESVK